MTVLKLSVIKRGAVGGNFQLARLIANSVG